MRPMSIAESLVDRRLADEPYCNLTVEIIWKSDVSGGGGHWAIGALAQIFITKVAPPPGVSSTRISPP